MVSIEMHLLKCLDSEKNRVNFTQEIHETDRITAIHWRERFSRAESEQ